MSYCRRSNDSDLYVIGGDNGRWECMVCTLNPGTWPDSSSGNSIKDLLSHANQHKLNGDKVPRELYERARDEIRNAQNGVRGVFFRFTYNLKWWLRAYWSPEEVKWILTGK